MISKKQSRIKRAKRSRIKIANLGVVRLCVHRTSQHIYAQIISEGGKKVIASASSRDKEFDEKSATGNIQSAEKVGELIGKRAVDAGIKKIAFDRSGFKYHGRVKALAEKARENGLEF